MMSKKQYIILISFFIILRIATIISYSDTNWYYGMAASQFAIAEAAYNGHSFSQDLQLNLDVQAKAWEEKVFIPIEQWKNIKKSGVYTTFPAKDLPGYGYLIAYTSMWFGHELTSVYAFSIQILLELLSLMLFLYCISLLFGGQIAFLSGLIYLFAYPFIWPVASLPMRDIFVMGTYSFVIGASIIFFRYQNRLSIYITIALLLLAALILWVRPSGYYYFFFVLPLILLFKQISIKKRLAFCLLTAIIALSVFGLPYKAFDLKYYCVKNTDILGRGLWEGMGIIPNNPYGFVLNDEALIPWVEKQGYKGVEYSSPKMNMILGKYAREIIKQDPVYYLSTISKRCAYIRETPLISVYATSNCQKSNLSQSIVVLLNTCLDSIYGPEYGKYFFFWGIVFTILLFYYLRNKRIEFLLLLTPLIYSLMYQIPTHFEYRYLAPAAWVLILPFAFIVKFIASSIKTWLDKSDYFNYGFPNDSDIKDSGLNA